MQICFSTSMLDRQFIVELTLRGAHDSGNLVDCELDFVIASPVVNYARHRAADTMQWLDKPPGQFGRAHSLLRVQMMRDTIESWWEQIRLTKGEPARKNNLSNHCPADLSFLAFTFITAWSETTTVIKTCPPRAIHNRPTPFTRILFPRLSLSLSVCLAYYFFIFPIRFM